MKSHILILRSEAVEKNPLAEKILFVCRKWQKKGKIMRNFITKIKTVCENTKTKAEILMNTAILTTMSAFPAYADLAEEGIKTAMGNVIDTGFLAASMACSVCWNMAGMMMHRMENDTIWMRRPASWYPAGIRLLAKVDFEAASLVLSGEVYAAPQTDLSQLPLGTSSNAAFYATPSNATSSDVTLSMQHRRI